VKVETGPVSIKAISWVEYDLFRKDLWMIKIFLIWRNVNIYNVFQHIY